MPVKFSVGNTLIMKKEHPCGNNKMTVLYTGSDVKIKCTKCGHELMVPRIKIEKNIKKVENGDSDECKE